MMINLRPSMDKSVHVQQHTHPPTLMDKSCTNTVHTNHIADRCCDWAPAGAGLLPAQHATNRRTVVSE
jgi:hypothetical protein